MTTLAVNKPRDFELGDLNDIGVIAADIIYEGAFVGDNGAGYARPLVAGDPFRGIALKKVDNAAGSAGDKTVQARQIGRFVGAISGFAITDVGKPVYASDDDTLTLTQGSNSYVGRAIRFIATGSAVVEFDASKGAHGLIGELTDNSGGAASGTIAAITDVPTRDAVASLAAKVNALARQVA